MTIPNRSSGFGIMSRVLVEIADDNGVYVDLNSAAPAGYNDYWGGLHSIPRLSIKSSIGTISMMTVDSIIMWNRRTGPWAAGFWDQQIPLSIQRSGVNYTFSTWRNRRVRISILWSDDDGQNPTTEVLGVFVLKLVRVNGATATLTIASFGDLLEKKKGDTIKDGSTWFKGISVKNLLRVILKATNSSMSLDDGGEPGDVSHQLFKVPRATSRGPIPGALDPDWDVWQGRSAKFIPRAIAEIGDTSGQIYVGFEIPGDGDNPTFALAKAHQTQWKWTPLIQGMTGIPVGLWDLNGSYVAVAVAVHNDPTETVDTSPPFYKISVYLISKSNGAWYTVCSGRSYWPCREAYRTGLLIGAYTNEIGRGVDEALNRNEFPICHFKQNIVPLYPLLYDPSHVLTTDLWTCVCKQLGWDSSTDVNFHRQVGTAYDGLDDDYKVPMAAKEAYSGAIASGAGALSASGLWRIFYGCDWPAPEAFKYLTQLYIMWIGHFGDATRRRDFRFFMVSAVTSSTPVEYDLDKALSGVVNPASTFTEFQVSAWCLSPRSTPANIGFYALFGIVEWDDSTSSPAIGRLKWAHWGPTPGADCDTVSTVQSWTLAPRRHLVRLWCPPVSTVINSQRLQWAVGVMVTRENVSAPGYGLVLIYASSAGSAPTVVTAFGAAAYTGPSSHMPFSGFTYCGKTSDLAWHVVQCIDQSTGQIVELHLQVDGTNYVFSYANSGLPVHMTERCCSTPTGLFLSTSPGDPDHDMALFPMAPEPPGDIGIGYWQLPYARPSRARHVPGMYPLVQFSKLCSDIIEVADLGGLNCREIMDMIAQTVPHYRMFLSGPSLVVRAAAPAPILRIVTADMQAFHSQDPSSPTFALVCEEGFSKYIDYESTCNSVSVPACASELTGKTSSRVIKSAGSKFSGQFLFRSNTDTPQTLVVSCYSGGDLQKAKNSVAPPQAILFRYDRIIPDAICRLAEVAYDYSTTLFVYGLTEADGKVLIGDSAIEPGDYVSLGGSEKIKITGVTTYQFGDYMALVLQSAIGVAGQPYDEVRVSRVDEDTFGGTRGVTGLSTSASSTTTILGVNKVSPFVVGMIIRVRSEYMKVVYVNRTGASITVLREQFGTVHQGATYATGEAIQVFIHIAEAGTLYPVGDTGVYFGVDFGDAGEKDVAERSLTSGDGLIVTVEAPRVVAVDGAVDISKSDASILRDGLKEESMPENRFVDPSRNSAIGQNVIVSRADPRIVLENVTLPMYPGLAIGAVLVSSDPRLVNVYTDVNIEIFGLSYLLESGRVALYLRSANAVVGAGGKMAWGEEAGAVAGTLRPIQGQRRR
jgi:hypothetical protein